MDGSQYGDGLMIPQPRGFAGFEGRKDLDWLGEVSWVGEIFPQEGLKTRKLV
jgi:hypothetical protein